VHTTPSGAAAKTIFAKAAALNQNFYNYMLIILASLDIDDLER
jgi:hypothetical protein